MSNAFKSNDSFGNRLFYVCSVGIPAGKMVGEKQVFIICKQALQDAATF